MKKKRTSPRFERLLVQGYRRLQHIDLELRPLMVLIGANGAGKTSLMEAWSLLAASCHRELGRTLSDLGGLSGVLTRDRALDCTLEVWFQAESAERLHYHLRLKQHGHGYRIEDEYLLHPQSPLIPAKAWYLRAQDGHVEYFTLRNGKKSVPALPNFNPLESALSQAPALIGADLVLRLGSCVFYGPLDVSRRSQVRMPQSIRPATSPGAEGEDLAACLYTMKETDSDRYEVLEDTLRAAFDRFERLEFPPVAAGKLSIAWREKYLTKPFFIHELSEGTIRFLWLAAVLLSADLPAVTLIEEPEISLHPELFVLLVDLMRGASARTQLVVATQSDRLVRFLKPEEVCAVDVEQGLARFTWGSDMDLDHWLAEYSLDELWQQGRLGARS